jgi:S1-C subfamily serine protease
VRARAWIVPLLCLLAATPARAQQRACACVAVLGLEVGSEWRGRGGSWSEVLVVRRAAAGSAAAGAGIAPGDTIVLINGLRASSQILWSIRRTAAPGDMVRLRIRRAGREQEAALRVPRRPPGSGS